jgi:ribA/ribD-fused uncharacterized protein
MSAIVEQAPTSVITKTKEIEDAIKDLYIKEVYPAILNKFKVVPDAPEGEKYGDFEIPKKSFYLKKFNTDPNVASKMYVVEKIKDEHVVKRFLVFKDGPFSNWSPCEIKHSGKTFYSVEQLFMYIKVTSEKYHSDDPEAKKVNSDIVALILDCRCPRAIQGLGRKAMINLPKWEEDCFDILKDCIKEKYLQNPEHMKFLDLIRINKLSIVEGQPDMKYACGVDFDPSNPEHLNPENWPGKNHLTEIYIKVIDEIFGKYLN